VRMIHDEHIIFNFENDEMGSVAVRQGYYSWEINSISFLLRTLHCIADFSKLSYLNEK
jgi:hypothetical protein